MSILLNKIQKEIDMITRQVVWLTPYTHVTESGVSLKGIIEHLPKQGV